MNQGEFSRSPARDAFAAATALLLAGGAQTGVAAADEACDRSGAKGAYCGLPNPEDLEVIPGGKAVIVSDMRVVRTAAGLGGAQGVLKLLNPQSGAVTPLYPAGSAGAASKAWGDPACPGEIGPALLPHGIHLSRRADGRQQLLVVNHGGRESVEFFELARRGGEWTLAWRGCIVPPGTNRLNDVAGLSGGGLVVTHMGSNRPAESGDKGHVWRWTPKAGFERIATPGLDRPNGIQTDARGRFAYVSSAAGGGTLGKLDLKGGRVVGTVAVPNPDNTAWTRDGQLLVTGMTPAGRAVDCFRTPAVTCPAEFEVYAVTPGTMRAERLLLQQGAPMGAGTVAVQLGRNMLIGSFAGDRVMLWRDAFAPHGGAGKR